ncbi:hypothetical protein NP493_54g03013 [Ridgeia piscesae]|uniref:ELMO domain-containing protein n=1 Tax=Ridgeia piscesae TaxID=27915 RepID=A0AAD9PB13_RIDPI|nr:hypothetical protein NP493_54g03013 [Ridgeia piscesae]
MPETAENIKKVAVIMDGQQTQFLELDQDRPLAAIIRDLCDVWALTNPDDFSLQFNEINRHGFITERNRVEIMKGNVLQLTFSPAKTAEQILYRLQNGSQEEKGLALKQLTELAIDSTFAQEFINKKGLQLIINMIEGGTCTGEGLAYTLKAFVELMDHSIVSWDVLDPAFIKTVSESINMRKGDACILQSALEIMENIVLHSANKYSLVEQAVTPVNLIQHLQSSNPDIQKNAIALINALFLKADPEKRKRITENLQSKSIRNVILNNVIRGSSSIGTEMAHQLYVLQSLMFNLLEGRRGTEIDINDQGTVKDILNLRKIAFDSEPDPNPIASRRESHARDFKKLGFQDNINPALDFTEVPPGILALDNIVYFAKMHAESFTKVVLENSCRSDDHDLPFAHASIALD